MWAHNQAVAGSAGGLIRVALAQLRGPAAGQLSRVGVAAVGEQLRQEGDDGLALEEGFVEERGG